MNRRGFLAVCVILCVCAIATELRAEDSPANPLFEQLSGEGVKVNAKMKASLPAPLMADGLDAAAQGHILTKIVGKRFSVRDFAGKGRDVPHIYEIRKIPVTGSASSQIYGVDVCFIAHGSLDRIAEKDFLQNLHKKQKDRKIHVLTAEELAKRKISCASDEHRQERYSHGIFLVLERIELRAALHTIITRRADSLLAATLIDPRFVKDVDFPNEWRKITIDEDGRRRLGAAQPYAGAGGYLKISRLHDPKGALFVEYHLIYTEPQGWFNGANPLRSKLPAIIQSEVRMFRQELNRSRDHPSRGREGTVD